jgi:ABC-type nitrate/sulfonate/bicarbonate transport system permease component
VSARIIWRVVGPLLLLTIGLVAWEAYVRYNDTPTWFLPAPSKIACTLWNDRSLLLENTWVTLQEVLAGFAVAVMLGVGLAIVINSSQLLEWAIYPLVIASQAIPLIALAPLLLVWFGYGATPKIIVTALIAFFPITVATVDGLRSADRELLDLLRSYGAGSWKRFRMVKVPSALPSFFSGAKIGISVAVIGAVFGEYVGADSGLGYLINISAAKLRTDLVFAAIVVLAVMAMLLFLIVAVIERRILRWRRYTASA